MEDITIESLRVGVALAALLVISLSGVFTTSPAHAQNFRACAQIMGTDDGMTPEAAAEGAREALEEAIAGWQSKNPGINPVRSAERPNPQPYWRSSVDPNLFFKPDLVDAETYTICWRGVISPAVCTAGARLCY